MKFTRRTILQLGLAGGAGALLVRSMNLQKFHRLALAFGTTIRFTVFAAEKAQAESAFDAAMLEVRAVEHVANLHDTKSEIARLNAQGILQNPDHRLLEMLTIATQIHVASEGAFDVSVQPLWRLYDDFAKRGSWPAEHEIAAAKALVNQAQIEISETLIRLKPGMALTLNGIAQGYAADRVAAVLSAHGIKHGFIDTGEIRTYGAAERGRVWETAIQHPRDEAALLGEFPLTGCLATSGDYQYFWSPDFAKNHILDPASAASPESFASVSVIAPNATLADALSTAIFVTGWPRGQALAQQFGAEMLGVTKTGEIIRSEGFPAFA